MMVNGPQLGVNIRWGTVVRWLLLFVTRACYGSVLWLCGCE
ncbi:hypothetical protein JCM19237_610 [Photobacterium aphoticum]|uniref:Uncharacterized protein n=1 Tax=Photobacterium aphoticum TaxID=754436 RepID=A0A090QQW0_9GAMM|nr:hypothetical protein JCM19237_610 [Photobacterium aphoticum]